MGRKTVGTAPYLFDIPDGDEWFDPPSDLATVATKFNTYLRSLRHDAPSAEIVDRGVVSITTDANGYAQFGLPRQVSGGLIVNTTETPGVDITRLVAHSCGQVWAQVLVKVMSITSTTAKPYQGKINVVYVTWENR